MADRNLKVVTPPEAKDTAPQQRATAGSLARIARKNLRLILLVVLPALAALIGLVVYLNGGRYISTDNAYVGAQKVLITPDISGKVERIAVREGQPVKAGDELLALDAEPFRLALAQAKAKLVSVRNDFEKLKSNLKSLNTLVELSQKNVELKQRDVERKSRLLTTQSGSAADVDNAAAGQLTAQLQARFATQQRDDTLNQLSGNPNLPIEEFPAFIQARSAVEQAQRDLDHTVLKAPIDGIATQVDNIQLGRFVAAGAPILSIIDDARPWVDANPKETDITHLRVGQKATIDVDTFPDHTFRGTVMAVSPGTGSQFSILPAQNASGNWVKVVQRVSVRIVFDRDEDTSLLRSGMSATVDIDTGHSRWPFSSAKLREARR
jgi:membrane fusion protein (multidrug efflux system)